MAREKTKTVFKRRVGVYLPDFETKADWEAAADERDLSLSEMVYQIVQKALHGTDEDAAARAGELQKEVGDLTGELASLRSRVQQLEVLNDRLDNELREYRAQVFLDDTPGKTLDRQLVHLLSTAKKTDGLPRVVGEDEIRKSLKIGPRDIDQNKAIGKNLEILERFELVKKTKNGWVWNA